MAGTTEIQVNAWGRITRVVWDWTTDLTGGADEQTTEEITGIIQSVTFVPDETDNPLDGYDVVIEDEDGADVLGGNGANISNTGSTIKTRADGLGVAWHSKLHQKVTNAGTGNKGKTILHLT